MVWVAIPFSRDLPYPGIELRSPALQAGSLPSESPGNSYYTLYLYKVYTFIYKINLKFFLFFLFFLYETLYS